MGRIAIITARGGSKRIPKKNIRDFCGKPILEYSIAAALESGLYEEVMVSTDSQEIADIARGAGAKVPFMRREETAGDYASTADVLREVLADYKARGREFDSLCCIYPTAPFVTADKLREAARILEEKKADAVVPVVRFGFPPQRGFVVRDGYTVMEHPEHATTRSQDLEPIFHDCGQFYMLDRAAFEAQGKIFMDHMISMEMPETEVQDIDNETDWQMAELKYRLMCRN